MKIEYDNLAEYDLLYWKCISEQDRPRIRKLSARSAGLLWHYYCYPGRFDFRAHSRDAMDATLVSAKPLDDLDEETVISQVATWLSALIDAADTETVYLICPEWSIDGFEVPWEVFLATWYWLLPFLPEGHAVIPSKNAVIEFDAVDCSAYRLSRSDAAVLIPDDLNNLA
jgi:hypothetical protein